MTVEIRRGNVIALMEAREFPELLAEYMATGDNPEPPDYAGYHVLEKKQALKIFVPYVDRVMVGFMGVLFIDVPHEGTKRQAAIDFFFVKRDARKTGAANKLRVAAEEEARAQGCRTLQGSAVPGSAWAKAAPRYGYKTVAIMLEKEL